MLLALPLMWGGAKPRVWIAMFAGSIAALYAPFVAAYMLIDLACSALVLKRPACQAQKAIGLLFVAMALFDLGYYFSMRADPMGFARFLSALGWIQFAILVCWGTYDRFGYRISRDWVGWFFRPSALGRA